MHYQGVVSDGGGGGVGGGGGGGGGPLDGVRYVRCATMCKECKLEK